MSLERLRVDVRLEAREQRAHPISWVHAVLLRCVSVHGALLQSLTAGNKILLGSTCWGAPSVLRAAERLMLCLLNESDESRIATIVVSYETPSEDVSVPELQAARLGLIHEASLAVLERRGLLLPDDKPCLSCGKLLAQHLHGRCPVRGAS